MHSLIRPAGILRSAIVLKPSNLFHVYHGLVKRKYRRNTQLQVFY